MDLQVIKNRIRKIFAYTLTGILFLVVSSFLILQIPPIQNAIVGRMLRNFSNVSGFSTRIENFRLLWFDRLELSGVSITDPEGNRMIGAKSILLNFNLNELLNQRDVNIDGIILDSAHVYLAKINESDTTSDLNINIFIYELNKLSKGEGGGDNPKVHIGEAVLSQSRFTYIDSTRDTIPKGFDYNHFTLLVDEGQVQNFQIIGDTLQFNVNSLIFHDEKTNFPIHELSTYFRISQSSMEFTRLNLRAGDSHIRDTVILTYNSQRDLQDFVNKVNIHAHLDSSIIQPRDLALFAPGAEKIGKPIRVSGVMNGRINNFKAKEMDVRIGNTYFAGALDMDGLPDINETFIFLNLSRSQFYFEDLDFLFNENTLARLTPLGRVVFDGQFTGYPSDFVAHGSFNNYLGGVISDINFKVNEDDIDKSEYSGKLKMINFDIGRYLNDTTLLQKVTMDGNLSGSGLTSQTAHFKLNGKINAVGVKGYNYTNIVTDATFASGFFKGALNINDPNLKISATGFVDLREQRNLINIQGTLDTASLQALKLSHKNILLKGKLDVDIKGLVLDSLIGIININDFNIVYDDEAMFLKNIYLNAQRKAGERAINLQTTLVDINVEGNYEISDLANDIDRLLYEITLNIKNNKEEIANYYNNKKQKPKNYQAKFEINVKDILPVSELLDLDIKTTPNTKINGSFKSGYTTIFRAYSVVDSVYYKGNLLLDTDVEVTASKIADSTNVLAVAVLNSQKQVLQSGLTLENLIGEGIWNQSHIDFQVDSEQPSQGNYIRLKGAVDFLRDSTKIRFLPSSIHLLDLNWLIDPDNAIVKRGNEWEFRQVEIMNREQAVRLNGYFSEDPEKKLKLQINALNLSILNVISKTKFSGIVNADVRLGNYYVDPSVENDVSIDSLTINDFLVGNVKGKNTWDSQEGKFNVNVFIDRDNTRIINLTGNYTPSAEETLDMNARFEKASVKLIEPFLKDIFSEMDGAIVGSFKIKGTLDDPLIKGVAEITNGQFLVNYTQALYRFSGELGMEPHAITFNNMDVMDVFKNKAKVNGIIRHTRFYKMSLDIRGDLNTFQVLNTTANDNSLFYGQAYATGDVRFYGPVEKMSIISNARTEKNTRLYIPIGGAGNTEKEEFINFVNFEKTDQAGQTGPVTIKKRDRTTLTGITFDLNLDVTPEAYCEIIFDLKAGDIIRGRGNGDLKLQLDTKGEFNMFGAVEFTEGWYNFTLYDIINKEFQIKKGSRITWYGDPYGATLNVDASYNQLASFAPLINSEELEGSTELKRKYPVQVLLNLEGHMLKPDIRFDILADNLPKTSTGPNGVGVSLDFVFSSFKARLDDQELKKQVFSLIILRKFSPPDAGFNTSGTFYNSVSELLSNQLSNWMSQVDENLEIDVDLGTMDQEAFNTFQLRLSYTFLNGRLRVTRDGTFGDQNYYSNTGTQSNASSLVGDWTIDYFLTPDGKFKVKMYNRTNYNVLSTSLNNQSYFTTGVSLQHVQSFNQFKDLIRFKGKEKNEVEEEKKKEPLEDEQKKQTLNKDGLKEDDDRGL